MRSIDGTCEDEDLEPHEYALAACGCVIRRLAATGFPIVEIVACCEKPILDGAVELGECEFIPHERRERRGICLNSVRPIDCLAVALMVRFDETQN